MSATSLTRIILLPLAIAFATPVFAAEDATVHQVYQAAAAGKFDEAQAMMDKVLRDHPNSGKAHYIEAELLAKQGRMIEAEPELAKAQRLDPGLPFAKPEAVQKLKALIARSSAVPAPSARLAPAAPATYSQPAYANRPAPAPSVPWGMIIMLVGILALVIFAIRAMRSKPAQTFQPAGPGGYGPAGYAGAPNQPYQPPYSGAPGAPGMGSGIMGGLATGAAVGAGIVAGEALMHHFTDRDNGSGNMGNANQTNYNPPLAPEAPLPDDMGGNDFGISDSGGSWDDGGGGGSDVGGDDW